MFGIVGSNCREVTKKGREKSEIPPKDAAGKVVDSGNQQMVSHRRWRKMKGGKANGTCKSNAHPDESTAWEPNPPMT
jgi:hypothetical protein